MKYKQLLLSPLGLLPMGMPPASAADMPVKAPQATSFNPSWAGWYAGVNLGVIADHSSITGFIPRPGTLGSYCFAQDCGASNSQTALGVLGGVQIGYNFQAGKIVYGVEADFDLSSARKTTSRPDVNAVFGGTTTVKSGVEALGTLRGRLGYLFDDTLLYATGGLAYAKMANAFQGASNPGPYSWSNTDWRAGFAVGGGIERQVSRKWSMKAEALYYDLGRKDHVSATSGGSFFADYGATDHMTGVIARIGLNYLFH